MLTKSLDWNTQYINSIKDDAGRSLMGARQENWFYRSLSQSSDRGAKWRIIGNQIVFSRIYYDDAKTKVNVDAWDVSSFPLKPMTTLIH